MELALLQVENKNNPSSTLATDFGRLGYRMFSLCVPSVFFSFLSKRKSFFKANFGYQRDLEVVLFKEFFFHNQFFS